MTASRPTALERLGRMISALHPVTKKIDRKRGTAPVRCVSVSCRIQSRAGEMAGVADRRDIFVRLFHAAYGVRVKTAAASPVTAWSG